MPFLIILLNAITFALYALDKHRAKSAGRRIPEAVLILLTVLGGSVGTLAAMNIFNHKTRKTLFNFGVPVIMMAQLFLCLFLV